MILLASRSGLCSEGPDGVPRALPVLHDPAPYETGPVIRPLESASGQKILTVSTAEHGQGPWHPAGQAKAAHLAKLARLHSPGDRESRRPAVTDWMDTAGWRSDESP